MAQDPLAGLAAFVATAEALSFSRAAERLGISPSALSHAMRGLEERLGVRLLARTTRSVAVTDAGARLLATLRPALADIAAGVEAVRTMGETPAGAVRLTAVKHAATSVLGPMLPGFLARFPGIRIEVDVDDGLTDIVARGYDAGIRFGGLVDRDMVSVRIGPGIGTAVVASPGYLADRMPPRVPRDVGEHRCILHRRPERAGTYPWRFQEDGRVSTLRVEGALAFSDSDLVLAAAVAGQGLAYVFADAAAEAVAAGRLVRLLEPFTVTLPGYEIYYPSRRQNPAALVVLLGALREARAVHGLHPPHLGPPGGEACGEVADLGLGGLLVAGSDEASEDPGHAPLEVVHGKEERGDDDEAEDRGDGDRGCDAVWLAGP